MHPSRQIVDQLPDRLPHARPTLVPISVGVSDQLGLGAKPEAVQHQGAGLGHDALGRGHRLVQMFQRRFDQDGVVDRRADANTGFGRPAARQAQHLGAVRLHQEVALEPRVGIVAGVDRPAEDRPQLAVKHGVIDGGIGPLPEDPVGLPVEPQEFPGLAQGLTDPLGQGTGFHAILDRQHAGLELIPRGLMAFLGDVLRNGPGLLGEGQVGIPRTIGVHHQGVSGERRRDTELLLGPVHIGQALARIRPDQPPQPRGGPEDEPAIAGLVAAGSCPEGGQEDTVAPVGANGQFREAHLGQGRAQLA